MRAVAGLVLTGGGSRRFGVDKATLRLDGETLGDRAVRVLGAVAAPVLEVGPSFTSAAAVHDDPPGRGPLVAISTGAAALRDVDAGGLPTIVLAVDLPFVDERVLRWLAEHPAASSVVPRVHDMPQTLCARYDSDALTTAAALVARGEHSVRALLGAVTVHYADQAEWGAITDARAFADVDTREDATAVGIEIPG